MMFNLTDYDIQRAGKGIACARKMPVFRFAILHDLGMYR